MYPLPFPTCWKYSRPYHHPTTHNKSTRGVSSSYLHLLEVQQALIITLPPTIRGYKSRILFLSALAGSTAGPYHHPITHNKRVQQVYPLPFPTCWKYSSPYHPTTHNKSTRGVSSSFPHLLEVQQALTITLPPTTREYKRSIPSYPHLLEVLQTLSITLSPTTRGYKRSILLLYQLAGSTAGPYYHPITHNKRVQGVFSSFPHLLEVQQALTITLSPTTRGHKRSILFLFPLAGSTTGTYHHPTTHKRVQMDYPLSFPTCWKYHYHHPTTHNKRVQEEYPLTIPTCWKYSRPLLSPYQLQQEGTRGVFSSFPHLLEEQQTLTITLPPTTRGYKWIILFLSPLVGSTADPYHHPTTHNKRVQEEHSLPFPTCWKYSRPLPSPYHPQQEV